MNTYYIVACDEFPPVVVMAECEEEATIHIAQSLADAGFGNFTMRQGFVPEVFELEEGTGLVLGVPVE